MIAHAHGFSAVEVAELLPIFLDNLRADFSASDGPAPALVPPAPQPGETPEEHAERYLRELAQNEHLDVVGYGTLGAADGGLGSDDLDGDDLHGDDLEGDDLDATYLGPDPTFLDATPEGGVVELDDAAGAVDQPLPDRHEAEPVPDLAEDDPFATSSLPDAAAPGVDDSFEGGARADDPGEPFATG